MTEEEWLASERPMEMLDFLHERREFNERRLRLFGVACCRHNSDLFADARLQRAVDVAERYADRQAGEGERREAETGVFDVLETQYDEIQPDGSFGCDPILALVSRESFTA